MASLTRQTLFEYLFTHNDAIQDLRLECLSLEADDTARRTRLRACAPSQYKHADGCLAIFFLWLAGKRGGCARLEVGMKCGGWGREWRERDKTMQRDVKMIPVESVD